MLNPKSQFESVEKGSLSRITTNKSRIITNKFVAIRVKEWVFQQSQYRFSFVIWCLVLGIFTGCASIKETAKSIAGISTKALEDGRKNAITKQFNHDLNNCYNKAKEALKMIGSYIYAEDLKKHSLAVYVSEADTTAVGIFFKEIDANNTQIEITSESTYAKEFIAENLFSVLDKVITAEELEAQINAKKQMENK